MRRSIIDDIEILSDDQTVWVNTAEGNIGRFGLRGIDVHTTITAQMHGVPQCLACTHEETNLADWREFQALMLRHHNVRITDKHMPLRFCPE